MSAEKKDFLIYDADCGFCQRNVDIMQSLTKEKISYQASHEIENGFYGISKESSNGSIKFFEHKEKVEALNSHEKVLNYEYHDVHEDAVIYHGAYAVFKALSHNALFKPILFAYENIPLVSVLTEAAYRIVARNRMQISKAIGADTCKIN